MKKAILKASLPISALLLASGLQVAQAHCIGPLSANFATATITAGSTATNQFDQYVVNCPATTLSLRARVSKAAAGTANAPMTLTIGKGGNNPQVPSASVSDTTSTATTACNGPGPVGESIGSGASAFVSVNGNAGDYIMTISKNSANTTYAAELHCHAGLNGTGAELTPVPTAAGLDFDRVVDN